MNASAWRSARVRRCACGKAHANVAWEGGRLTGERKGREKSASLRTLARGRRHPVSRGGDGWRISAVPSSHLPSRSLHSSCIPCPLETPCSPRESCDFFLLVSLSLCSTGFSPSRVAFDDLLLVRPLLSFFLASSGVGACMRAFAAAPVPRLCASLCGCVCVCLCMFVFVFVWLSLRECLSASVTAFPRFFHLSSIVVALPFCGPRPRPSPFSPLPRRVDWRGETERARIV